MKKLSLSVESLVVESFTTANGPKGAGTIIGHIGYTGRCDTVNATCDGGNTCGNATCGGVLEQTCVESCQSCDVYHCGTLDGYDCTYFLNCMSDNGQCPTGASPDGC
ncbi:hypothetical protein [Longimicrobium sp.]|uniref:hypothetical protein n=1 Tax=Longimicrobium sp. TaxID=2029185 RepID=UPI002B7630F4|nr:hypothetical protein [Longimicrobium sp.]HSU15122.1 hypothetical protein [Longimicrobium sp.]